MAGVLLMTAALVLWVQSVSAAPAYTPYAKSVNQSSPGVINADNAVGAPNGTTAQMVGVNSILTLDVGAGEEGTQSLRAYFGPVSTAINVSVDFLDSNKAVIASQSRQLAASVNASTQTFAYNWRSYTKAYRFVRISSSVAGAGVNVDAVEKTGYIGSTATQDTDGDGVPDRTETQNGTNPLVPDAPSANNNGNNSGSSTTGGTTNNTGAGNTAGSGATSGKTTSSNGKTTTKPASQENALTRLFGDGASLKNISGWQWLWIWLLVIAAIVSWWFALTSKVKAKGKKPALRHAH